MKKEEITLPKVAGDLIKAHFSKIEERFLQLKDEETFLKECSFAMQICQSNSMLKKADALSVLECVINLAQTDLTLNPILKLSYLIPFREDDKIKCRIEPSYQGLMKLITDTGSARSISAAVVYSGDEFEVEGGTNPKIKHVLKFKSKEVFAVYSVATLSDGSRQFEVMTVADVEDIRANSEAYKFYLKKTEAQRSKTPCIWVDHFEEMAKKTVVKRLVKYLPKTDIFEKLGHAIKLDNQDFGATDSQIDMIDGLIMQAAISPEELQEIQIEIDNGMTRDQASELIGKLKALIPDAIESGNNYSRSDAQKKVSEKLNDPKS